MLNSVRSSAPATKPAPAKPAAAKPAPRAAAAADAYVPSATDVKVVTFNTAIGNPAIKTDQKDFLTLPFYKKALEGAPDAPILCLQEVGDAQREAVERMAKSGKFTVLGMGVGVGGKQNNMVVIPKRYQVLEQKNESYGFFSQLKAGFVNAAKGLWGWVKGGFKGNPSFTQLVEPRGYQQFKLKDTVTGKTFTLFNTHTSFYDGIRGDHLKQLFAAARAAEKQGPVIVAGDLNTRTAENDTTGAHAADRRIFEGYADMGPKGIPPEKSNIDWVLAKGFESKSSKWYTGESIALPGSPNALAVSDHYAEEDVLAFKQ